MGCKPPNIVSFDFQSLFCRHSSIIVAGKQRKYWICWNLSLLVLVLWMTSLHLEFVFCCWMFTSSRKISARQKMSWASLKKHMEICSVQRISRLELTILGTKTRQLSWTPITSACTREILALPTPMNLKKSAQILIPWNFPLCQRWD